MNMRTNSEDDTREALAMLPLPAHDSLSQHQRRGAACVWDGVTLTPATAIGLGPRPILPSGPYDWYPRGCRRCIASLARRAVTDHTGLCEQCTDDASVCETRAALERLVREGR